MKHEAAKVDVVEPGGDAPRRHGTLRQVRRRVRGYFAQPLVWLATRVAPLIYITYMKLVFATSRVEDHGFTRLHEILDRYGGAVSLVWHEEMLTAIYGYRYMGFHPSTLASRGDAGAVATHTLQRLGYEVFRGGSSRRESRKSPDVLRGMIEHMRTRKNVLWGLAVDGSKGPPYRIKPGGIVIARECGKPLVLQRTWHKRCLRLRLWDRMAVPLPFNVITFDMKGPYFAPDYAHTDEGLKRFLVELENDLIDLTGESYDRFGQARPENLIKRNQ